MKRATGLAFVALCALPSVAQATYSIVAADLASQQVGGAATSCVGQLSLSIV